MKRLLILGATIHAKHIIDAAHEMGVYTVVTDYVKGAAAKKYADKAYDVSTLDVDALSELCEKEKIDGVLAGYVDINMSPYYQLCKRLSMPYFCTDEQIFKTMNKVQFKAMCRKHGIAVPDDINVDGDYEKTDFPVMVKPADNYASRGITLCTEAKHLDAAIEKAYSFSKRHEILVEEFIDAPAVQMYYNVQNGYVSLSAMADKLISGKMGDGAPQPMGFRFPSEHLKYYLENINPKVQSMIEELGVKNGTFFIQGFAAKGTIVFLEMGLRLSGGCAYLHIKKQNEADPLKMLINFALGNGFGPWDVKKYDNPDFKKPAADIIVLLKEGTIAKIEGLEEIKSNPSCIEIMQLRDVGDEMDEIGTLNQVFARFFLCCETEEELEKTIKFIKSVLKITDSDGNNMIISF